MVTVLHTDYRESGASNLLSYMNKEEGNGLHNRYGEEMTNAEIQHFVEKSEAHEFERSIIVSPENRHTLSDDELSLYARKTMQEFTEDRPTADYCYAVHRDSENPHVHVALTGTKDDLYMNTEDIESVREDAHTKFVEQHQENTPSLLPEHEFEQDNQHNPGRSR